MRTTHSSQGRFIHLPSGNYLSDSMLRSWGVAPNGNADDTCMILKPDNTIAPKIIGIKCGLSYSNLDLLN